MSIVFFPPPQEVIIKELRLAYKLLEFKEKVDAYIITLDSSYIRSDLFELLSDPKVEQATYEAELYKLYIAFAQPRFSYDDEVEHMVGELRLPWGLTENKLSATCAYPTLPHELVGEISQDFLLCSYNEDDVRQIWLRGGLNDYLKPGKERFLSDPGPKHWLPLDGDIDSFFTFIIKMYGFWPTNYATPVQPIGNLTEVELAKLAAFDEDEYVTRQSFTRVASAVETHNQNSTKGEKSNGPSYYYISKSTDAS